MPRKKPTRTPSVIMRDIINSAIDMRGETQKSVAKKIRASEKTVNLDMANPERIPQYRLWLYFTVLDIPVTDILSQVGNAYVSELIKRE